MNEFARILNATVILILTGILLAAFGVQFIEHELPCPLCMLQRSCMIAAAIGFLMNLKFGIKIRNYGLCLISSLVGGSVALRQITLHICPGFSTFGIPVLGLSLYTWSFLIFACIVLSVSLLLFLYRSSQEQPVKMTLLDNIAFGSLFFIVFANIFSTYYQCGFGPCSE